MGTATLTLKSAAERPGGCGSFSQRQTFLWFSSPDPRWTGLLALPKERLLCAIRPSTALSGASSTLVESSCQVPEGPRTPS